MNPHAFFTELRKLGLTEKEANSFTNRVEWRDLGEYAPAMLALVHNRASVPTILELCRWAKRNQVAPNWIAKRAVLFSQYRNLGESAIMLEIHEQLVR